MDKNGCFIDESNKFIVKMNFINSFLMKKYSCYSHLNGKYLLIKWEKNMKFFFCIIYIIGISCIFVAI